MKVHTEIDDEDLDDRFPDAEDDDEEPTTAVTVVVRAHDSTGHHGTVFHIGADHGPDVLAEALVSAVHGAARTHSPALAAAVERWLVVPPDIDIVPGGDDDA